MSIVGWLRFLLVPLAALLAASGLTSAAASTPMPAAGTFTYTSSTFNDVRTAGGNTIVEDLSATVSYTGTFSGTSSLHGVLIIHADGSANFHDVEVFSGTVNGVPGSLTFSLKGTGSVVPSPGSFQGTDTILSGTGALASLTGVLKEVGTVPMPAIGPLGTYTGQIQSG